MRTHSPSAVPAVLVLLAVLCACVAPASCSVSNSTEDTIARLRAKAESQANAALLAVAPLMVRVRTAFPREHLNISLGGAAMSMDTFKSYGIGIAKIAGPGLVLGLVAAAVGLFYVPIRLCCACCSKRRPPKEYTLTVLVRTLIVAAALSILVIFGSAVGMTGNGRFSDGLTVLDGVVFATTDSVLDIGDEVVGFVDGIVPHMQSLVDSASSMLGRLPAVVDAASPVRSDLADVAGNLSTAARLIAGLRGLTPRIAELKSSVSASAAAASRSLADVTDLVDSVGGDLEEVANDSQARGAEAMAEARNTTAEVRRQVENITGRVAGFVDTAKRYADMVLSYDRYRLAGFYVLLAVPFATMVLTFAGFFTKQSWAVIIGVCLGFVALSTLMILGALHLILGMALGDGCQVAATIELPTMVHTVLDGCEQGENIFAVMNMTTPFNASAMIPTGQIDAFSELTGRLNMSTIGEAVARVRAIAGTDLSVNDSEAYKALGLNFTTGSPETEVAKLVADLNAAANASCASQECQGVVYTTRNYTSLNVTLYAAQARDGLAKAVAAITKANETIAEVAEFKAAIAQIGAALRALNASASRVQEHMSEFNATVTEFVDEVFVAVKTSADEFVAYIDTFAELGQCKFLPDAVNAINATICQTMMSCLDLLAMGCCTAGLFSLPLIAVHECMVRMSRKNRKGKQGQQERSYSKNAVYPEPPTKIEVGGKTVSMATDDSERGLN
eukprot:m51a1_g14351 hypothetical protein (732) ;mRNA; f:189469-192251